MRLLCTTSLYLLPTQPASESQSKMTVVLLQPRPASPGHGGLIEPLRPAPTCRVFLPPRGRPLTTQHGTGFASSFIVDGVGVPLPGCWRPHSGVSVQSARLCLALGGTPSAPAPTWPCCLLRVPASQWRQIVRDSGLPGGQKGIPDGVDSKCVGAGGAGEPGEANETWGRVSPTVAVATPCAASPLQTSGLWGCQPGGNAVLPGSGDTGLPSTSTGRTAVIRADWEAPVAAHSTPGSRASRGPQPMGG